MKEAVILEDVVAEVMVVTKTTGMTDKMGTTAAQHGRGNG